MTKNFWMAMTVLVSSFFFGGCAKTQDLKIDDPRGNVRVDDGRYHQDVSIDKQSKFDACVERAEGDGRQDPVVFCNAFIDGIVPGIYYGGYGYYPGGIGPHPLAILDAGTPTTYQALGGGGYYPPGQYPQQQGPAAANSQQLDATSDAVLALGEEVGEQGRTVQEIDKDLCTRKVEAACARIEARKKARAASRPGEVVEPWEKK